MSVCFAALMCHAPIVVPEVGRQQGNLCAATTRSMREVAQRCVDAAPDRLVVISPHTPRAEESCACWGGEIRGSLAAFGAPEVRFALPVDEAALRALELAGELRGELDHGAGVPLAFLTRAGWSGPTLVLGLPAGRFPADRMGRRLARLEGRTAIIASGDLSHRLRPGAPAGYHPRAVEFDRAFVNGLREGQWRTALAATARAVAAEDVVASCALAMAAVTTETGDGARRPLADEVLSYQAPWGVGYAIAILHDPDPPLYAVARQAVNSTIGGLRRPLLTTPGPPSQGLFVTLHAAEEEATPSPPENNPENPAAGTGRLVLRGCCGRIAPCRDDLYTEVAELALSAAREDPRFPPVRQAELSALHYTVSLLEPPEAISSPAELNPAIHGVVVEARGRRGVLLPAIPGIETAAAAIDVARRKAGIGANERYRLRRFTVQKVAQPR